MDQKLQSTLLVLSLFSGQLIAAATSSSHTSCKCRPAENETEAYSLPANIQLSNGWGENNLFATASYTYWYASEEGLDIARSGDFLVADDPLFNPSNSLLTQPFRYHSGFQVGIGWRHNDWVLSGEYTWVRNSTSKHSQAPAINPDLGTGVWVVAPWFLQLAQDGGSLFGSAVASKWNLHMDIADLMLSRPYYVSRHLTITPFGGLRAAWIRQKLKVALTELTDIVIPLTTPEPIHSINRSHSWAIGPRFGMEANVLLGEGFRIEGDLALSLLFTEYTKIFHREEAAGTALLPEITTASQHNKVALRPVLETGLGFGWSRYLFSKRYHIDFSADYDFMLWWNQNMLRKMMNSFWNRTSTTGDLFLHGLTLTGTFSF